MKRTLKYWIKERRNPQTGAYYVPMGQLTKAHAKKIERPLYGDNYMHPFDSYAEYIARIAELKKIGCRIHE